MITWGEVDLLSAVRLLVLLESVAGNLFFRLLALDSFFDFLRRLLSFERAVGIAKLSQMRDRDFLLMR